MSELINSSGSFYLNAETYNSSSVPVDAVITISDRDDILKFQEHWAVHCTRFAVDTQASLYYVVPDDDAWVTLTTVMYVNLAAHATDTSKHFVDQRTLRMTNGASTLADFLHQLNDSVPVIQQDGVAPIPTIAGGRRLKTGRWTVTPSGSFKFEAVILNYDGTIADINAYHGASDEYMVNVRMSETMRKILGFKNANLRVLGNKSKLRLYRECLGKFMDALPAYRGNIDNWRWNGGMREWHKNNWFSEMWYIINSVVLRGVPIDENGHVDMANHPTHGDFARPNTFPSGLRYWEDGDYLVSNYMTPQGRNAAGVDADSTHAYTQFSRLHALVPGHHDNADQLLMRDIDGAGPGNAIHAQTDHRWSDAVNQNGSAYGGFDDQSGWIGDNKGSGKWAFVHNAKQTWGSWTRAYVLRNPNARQIYINVEPLINVQGVDPENVGDGGYSRGVPPEVGDTIYIPGSANYDGSGEVGGGYINDYDRMQRGIITNVGAVNSVDRINDRTALGADYFGEPAWLITFDTILEDNINRSVNLSCKELAAGAHETGNSVGDPRARVIYGTRRLPGEPMVYIGIVDNTVQSVNDQIMFTSTKEFPVSVGDSVYIGHTLNASKQVHLVTQIDYDTGFVTIEAHGITELTAETVVIGMVKDSVYAIVHQHDKNSLAITCASIAIPGGNNQDTTIDPAVCEHRVTNLETTLINSKSASHIRVTPDTEYGLTVLTEAETNTPDVIQFLENTGQVTIGSDVVRAGGDATINENSVVVTELMENIGASARFTRANDMGEVENNLNLSPSNYFFVDLPENTGSYEAAVFNSFMEGHYREDWFLALVHMQDNDGDDGYVNPKIADQDNEIEIPMRVDNDYVLESTAQYYLFKICGLATTLANTASLGDPELSTFTSRKFVCYLGDRSRYPGSYDTPNQLFDTTKQFFQATQYGMNADDEETDFPAIFGKLRVQSGSNFSNGVQAIFKGNHTLDITGNTLGINLSVRTNDYMVSERSGQVDVAFPYKSISLTSNDLMAVPERSGDANQLQPILSSYSIPTMFDAGTSTSGEISSFTSTPYGTITFSEGGARRYHNLTSIPGGLRQFTVRCILDPKDDTKPKTAMKIPAGGRFSLQLVFVRK